MSPTAASVRSATRPWTRRRPTTPRPPAGAGRRRPRGRRVVGPVSLFPRASHQLQRGFDPSPGLGLFGLALLLVRAGLQRSFDDRLAAMGVQERPRVFVDLLFVHRMLLFRSASCSSRPILPPSRAVLRYAELFRLRDGRRLAGLSL